jgi:hypothetical protein
MAQPRHSAALSRGIWAYSIPYRAYFLPQTWPIPWASAAPPTRNAGPTRECRSCMVGASVGPFKTIDPISESILGPCCCIARISWLNIVGPCEAFVRQLTCHHMGHYSVIGSCPIRFYGPKCSDSHTICLCAMWGWRSPRSAAYLLICAHPSISFGTHLIF